MANLTLYTIIRKICHIKDCANHRAKAVGGRLAGRPHAPATPGDPENPHVCVLNLAGSVSGREAFTNPQVDGLRDFRLLPLSELKRKHAPFFRASRPKDARNPPLCAGIPALGAALPSAYCIQPTTLPSARSPPRLYTPGAHDFPLMCTSVAHDSSRICTLDVHGFSCVAQCAPSAPTFLAGLRFSIQCRTSARQTRRASRRSSGRASTRAFSRWPNPHPPRPLPHRSRR